jgi:tetratricopeptide (TPR) repeat protein
MKKHLTLFLCFLTISLTTYAQKLKKTNPNNPIIITAKALSPQDSSFVKELFLTGLREKTSAHYLLAKDYFERVLTIDASNHAAMFELAQLALSNNQLDVAQEYAERSVTVNPDNTWYWLLNANIYQQQKNYPLLVYALNELINLNPQKSEYKFDKANALFMINKNTEALAIFNAIEATEGINDELLAAKQRVYLKTGDVQKAAKDIETLITKQPDHIRYYLLLAQLYFSNDMHPKAIQVLQNALSIDEFNYETRLLLASIYNSDKNEDLAYEQILKAFNQAEMPIDQKVAFVLNYFNQFPDSAALKKASQLAQLVTVIHPENPKSFSLYGDVLYQNNKLADAEPVYQKALDLNANVFAIWEQLIRIKLSLNNYNGAITAAETAIELFPNQAALYYYLGLSYGQTKQTQKAIVNLKQAIELEISDKPDLKSQIYSSLGDVYQEAKQYKESAQAYTQSLTLLPNNAYTLNNYAYYLSLRNQNLAEAEKMAKRANEIEPNNPSFQDTYAWVLFKLKRYDDAKIWIEKAMLDLDTKSPIQFEHYGDILYKLGDVNKALLNWQKAIDYGEKSLLLKRKINEKKYLD